MITYLPLDSIANSKYIKDIEVLIIDDGSTDGTQKECEPYYKEYPDTFIYIKKQNGGHGSTINKGISIATGKYFRVLDGDDYFDTNALDLFIEKIKVIDTDMVISDFRLVDDQKNRRIDPAVVHNGKSVFDRLNDGNEYSLCTQFDTRIIGLSSLTIKTKLLQNNHVSITENCYYVDIEYVVWCIFLSSSFYYFKKPLYMYRKQNDGGNSVSKTNMIKNIKMQERVSLSLLNLYKKFDSQGSMCDEKKKIIFDRIALVIGATMRTYLLMKKSRNRIVKFDNQIKSVSPELFHRLDNNKFIHYTRMFNYSSVPLIKIAYMIWVRK